MVKYSHKRKNLVFLKSVLNIYKGYFYKNLTDSYVNIVFSNRFVKSFT